MLCTVLGICATLSGVPHIHDGDTLIVQGQSVRLYGIDAEELGEPNGYPAKYALMSLINRQPITCRGTGASSHHRIIARCYLRDGHEINRLMVSNGHALDCRAHSRGQYRNAEPANARARLIQKPYC